MLCVIILYNGIYCGFVCSFLNVFGRYAFMDKFELVSEYKPTGDQSQAIKKLVDGLNKGYREQTLLGVTGSGKTFTMANIIAQVKTYLGARS